MTEEIKYYKGKYKVKVVMNIAGASLVELQDLNEKAVREIFEDSVKNPTKAFMMLSPNVFRCPPELLLDTSAATQEGVAGCGS